MLDVACGKGRHSVQLAEKGHIVTGIDISPNSIASAKQFENNDLEFYRHDMRLPFRINYYHYVFNLFTSFGYFNTRREHDDTLRTIASSLRPGGFFILDYLNSVYVGQRLVASEEKQVGNTLYRIKRHKTETHFFKEIEITDPSLPRPVSYTEKVAAFTQADFEAMFRKQGLQVKHWFGDYSLNSFHETKSKRLIVIAEK
ncbi:MAG: class I SAM-dependent methyltransferase, partial [Dinghuibacter sp.]|nr:class I SAM-dependent methyltransferase [Dinghuibacter sp.]